jgi:hypothetical protein
VQDEQQPWLMREKMADPQRSLRRAEDRIAVKNGAW